MAIFNWRMTFTNYAQLIFKLRRGESPFVRAEHNTFRAMSYIGYQIRYAQPLASAFPPSLNFRLSHSHSALGFLLVFVLCNLLIIVASLLYLLPIVFKALLKLVIAGGISALIRFIILAMYDSTQKKKPPTIPTQLNISC